jgi:hypothetical protein
MNRNEAMQLALGYAWASEDVSHVKTADPTGRNFGSFEFANAFADMQEAYNTERRGSMGPVADAYSVWQNTRGATADKHAEFDALTVQAGHAVSTAARS